MSGSISASGLITGVDSATIINQLMALERKPITRIQEKISNLRAQQTAVRSIRTQLMTLRSRAQDFRFDAVFTQHKATSSDTEVATGEVTGENPVLGSYKINVTQLATATVASSSRALGGAIDPALSLKTSGITTDIEGTKFSINGVDFTFDPETNSLNDIIGMINSSSAGVTASYDPLTDLMTLANTTAGDTSLINLSHTDSEDEANSNLLTALSLSQATQSTNASGSTQLSSTRILGAVDPSDFLADAGFGNGTVTSGTFSINGVSITIDAATDSLADVVERINSSNAQVTASYDSATDSLRFVSKTMGSRTIRFASGTSNFLEMTNLTTATQTAGKDSQFTVNDGPVQTRNTNSVSDTVGGVTIKLLSEGTSTISVETDEEAIVEKLNTFITAFNDSVSQLQTITASTGAAPNDGTLRTIQNYIRTTVFDRVGGISGAYESLAQIGITTGDDFDSTQIAKLELDSEEFLKAYREGKTDIEQLFTNEGETGIADMLFTYLDSITASTGFLNQRVKSNGTIDEQITAYNDRITQIEARIEQKTIRLKAQFTRLETMSQIYQQQSTALSSL